MQIFQEVEEGAAEGDDGASNASSKPAIPVLSAHAGDLYFEYTPVSSGSEASSSAGGGGMKEGKEGVESNRAPSPGSYAGSRTIHVVSFVTVPCLLYLLAVSCRFSIFLLALRTVALSLKHGFVGRILRTVLIFFIPPAALSARSLVFAYTIPV